MSKRQVKRVNLVKCLPLYVNLILNLFNEGLENTGEIGRVTLRVTLSLLRNLHDKFCTSCHRQISPIFTFENVRKAMCALM